jgi:hypothetical protein
MVGTSNKSDPVAWPLNIDHPKINFNISPLAKHQSEMQFASLGYTMLILHPIK